MKIQPEPSKNLTFYRLWSCRHEYCQACGVPASKSPWPGLSTHHVIKQHRAHEACVLLRLCQTCHDAAEGLTVKLNGVAWPKLTIGICLTLKASRESAEVDWKRCRQLRGSNLPDFEPVPAVVEEAFRRWRPRDTELWFYAVPELEQL